MRLVLVDFVLIAAVTVVDIAATDRTVQMPHAPLLLALLTADAMSRLNVPRSDIELHHLINEYQCRWPATTRESLHLWRLRRLVDAKPTLANELVLQSPLQRLVAGEALTGRQVEELVCDDSRFHNAYPDSPTWLYIAPAAAAACPRAQHVDASGKEHPDQFLATLAKCGVDNDELLMASGMVFTVGDVMWQLTYEYRPSDMAEYSAVASACYLAPASGFESMVGQWVT